MITTTRSPARNAPACPRPHRAFTLMEVMLGAGLSGFILTAVITSFVFLGRSGTSLQHYNDMESQSRTALEQFAQDVRQASSINWNSNSSITLIVDSTPITYAFASNTFSRTLGTTTRVLITGISNFEFKAYTIAGVEIPDIGGTTALVTANQSTKQLQLSLRSIRNSQSLATASSVVLSARFIMRNKRVTA